MGEPGASDPEGREQFGDVMAVVWPSTVALTARITSRTPLSATRATSRAMFSSSGPIPSSGDKAPPST
jgi:hypothetical protein